MSLELLETQMHSAVSRLQLARLAQKLAWIWAVAALTGVLCLAVHRFGHVAVPWAAPILLGATGVATALAVRLQLRHPPELSAVGLEIERTFPELQGLVLTALQVPRDLPLHLLQQRVVESALRHGLQNDWAKAYPNRRLLGPAAAGAGALMVLLGSLMSLGFPLLKSSSVAPIGHDSVEVLPGNTELERGKNLIVSARFQKTVPTEVELITRTAHSPEQRVPLTRSLADPIFGGAISELGEDVVYSVAYSDKRTPEFKVHVFELPRSERADAILTYPDYAHLAARHLGDVRRVAALEGTKVQITFQLNHAVTAARLIPRTHGAPEIVLSTGAGRAQATLDELTLVTNATYDLRLADAEGRTNRPGPPLVFEAIPNSRPELKLTSPRGDLRPSPLEEISWSGTVWDDLGVVAYGLGFSRVGQETQMVELGHDVAGREKHPFQHLLALEDLHLKPGQLLSWFAWADDVGPDGQVRRTTTDLFFAETRPYDEIFREGKSPDGAASESSASDQGNPSEKLAEIQKQIISATWKLRRDAGPPLPKSYATNQAIVRESQVEALRQAMAQKKRASGPRTQQQWQNVTAPMTTALSRLNEANQTAAPLTAALAAEESAYQALLALASKENEVTRQRQNSRGKSQSQRANQRQLEELDIAQSDNKYETQKQAQALADPQQKEQSQILERLKELARRQEDLNERMKELQSALTAADKAAEKEELRKQLKRLEDEQRQMVADADELRQRMDRPENQSAMNQPRQALDETRSEMDRASQAASRGELSQALAAGTRAQEQLQQQREALRKQSGSQLSEQLKELRTESRELARRQAELGNEMQSAGTNSQKSLDSSGAAQATLEKLALQQSGLTNLVERARQVAQLAETAEPRASQKIEDSLRRFEQDETATLKQFRQALLRERKLTRNLDKKLEDTETLSGAKSLELASELTRQGYLPEAVQAEQKARATLDALNQGMEQAAAAAVGDDSEALRQAARDLDAVTDALKREFAQAEPEILTTKGGTKGPSAAPTQSSGAPSGAPSDDSNSDAAGNSPRVPNTEVQRSAGGSAGPNRSNQTAAGKSPGNGGSPRADRSEPGNRSNLAGGPPNLGADRAERASANNSGGGGQNPEDFGNDGSGGRVSNPGGPLTGPNFTSWSDRLRDVEEAVDSPALRNSVASARERARQLRIDYKNNRQKPDWAQVRLQVVQPLVEVRNRIAEDLARRSSKEALVPLDRDPVPPRYSELVRHYYQELGKDH